MGFTVSFVLFFGHTDLFLLVGRLGSPVLEYILEGFDGSQIIHISSNCNREHAVISKLEGVILKSIHLNDFEEIIGSTPNGKRVFHTRDTYHCFI